MYFCQEGCENDALPLSTSHWKACDILMLVTVSLAPVVNVVLNWCGLICVLEDLSLLKLGIYRGLSLLKLCWVCKCFPHMGFSWSGHPFSLQGVCLNIVRRADVLRASLWGRNCLRLEQHHLCSCGKSEVHHRSRGTIVVRAVGSLWRHLTVRAASELRRSRRAIRTQNSLPLAHLTGL